MNTPWDTFESYPSFIAALATWRERLQEHFGAFRALCLDPTEHYASWVSCPRGCGCDHRVEAQPDGSFLACCTCEPPGCPPFPVTLEDITGLEINRRKLATAICRAFLLAPKFCPLDLYHTDQIGAWSADAVPAILTLQLYKHLFRAVVAELVATLGRPFILFGPTNDFLDARCQSFLRHCGAGFFALDTHTRLTPQGTLLPLRPPGELFAQFNPQPVDPIAEQNARLLFVYAASFDGRPGMRKAPPSVVLRLFCLHYCEPPKIAHTCRCSLSLVYARLELLARKLRCKPSELRQFSPYLQTMVDSLSDPRARRRPAAPLGG